MTFLDRLAALPHLGLGISTEYGAGDRPGALDVAALRAHQPGLFLEVGVEVAVGLDAHARAWAAQGWPTTYHFLDVNLDDPEDLDPDWLAGVQRAIATLRPAWLCGDAGLWHFADRDRGHMLLLPPILTPDAVSPMADGVRALREATGLEVLPETPPGNIFLGELHLLDFFSRLADAADTGILLDVAHLAMFQRARGHALFDGFSDFTWDRVIEVHVAGGVLHDLDGLAWIEDAHGVDVLPEVWSLTEAVLARAPNCRAVVVEAERNPLPAVRGLMAQVAARWPGAAR